MPIEERSPWVSYLLALAEIRGLARSGSRGAAPSVTREPLTADRFHPQWLAATTNRRCLVTGSVLQQTGFPPDPDPARVVVRPFKPATEPRDYNPTDKSRANHIVDRVLGMEPAMVTALLADVLENFLGRHRNLLQVFEARATEMEEALVPHAAFTVEQRHLVGAYFLHEYSFEAAALFQSQHRPASGSVGSGGRREPIHSEPARDRGRACMSSLTFRSGIVAADGGIQVDPPARLASIPRVLRRWLQSKTVSESSWPSCPIRK